MCTDSFTSITHVQSVLPYVEGCCSRAGKKAIGRRLYKRFQACWYEKYISLRNRAYSRPWLIVCSSCALELFIFPHNQQLCDMH